MAYQPTSNCNAANYNPNDVVQDYQSEQTAVKAANDYWKNQMAGATQQCQAGLSGIGSALIGKPIPTKSLQDEADRVRSQSDQIKNLLVDLHEKLFEPLPLKGCGQNIETNNPSTVEGNLQHAARTLSGATLTLENILAKIGGR